MAIGRGRTAVEISSVTQVEEDPDGRVVSFASTTDSNGTLERRCGKRTGARMQVTTVVGDAVSTADIPWPGDAFVDGLQTGPLARCLREPGHHCTLHAFDATTGKMARNHYVLKAMAPLPGWKAPVFKKVSVKEDVPGAPVSTVWFDDRLVPVREELHTPQVRFEVRSTTREEALQPLASIDLFSRFFIPAPRELETLDRSAPLTFELAGTDGVAPTIIETDEQQVHCDGVVCRVTVTPRPIPPSPLCAGEVPAEVAPFLLPGPFVQSDAVEICDFARRAADGGDAATATINLTRAISRHVSVRHLSSVYDSALTVLRSGEGDCTEFALLAAASLRALGCPSRVVNGIVFVSDDGRGHQRFFGAHAWTQFWQDGRWYSMDAAFGHFDATHIALEVHDGSPSSGTSAMLGILSGLKVVSVRTSILPP